MGKQTKSEAGTKGGKARKKSLSAKDRVRIATSGGKALWEKIRRGELSEKIA